MSLEDTSSKLCVYVKKHHREMLSNDVCLTTHPEIRCASLSLCPFWRRFSLCLGREDESWKKTAWKVTFSYESISDDYQEKKSSTQLNLIVVTPSSFEIQVKICDFWLIDTSACCYLPLCVTLSVQHLFLKICKILSAVYG